MRIQVAAVAIAAQLLVAVEGHAAVGDQIDKFHADNLMPFAAFGSAVSLSGNLALVSSPVDDSGVLIAYVLQDDGSGNWSHLDKLTIDDGSNMVDSGIGGISISGDVAVVGVPGDNGGLGSAYVFRDDGFGNWSQSQKLTADVIDPPPSAFGKSVSIHGDSVLIGAPNWGDMGFAFFFENDGADNWTQVNWIRTTDRPPFPGSNAFGLSVDLDGDQAIVGAPGVNAAYVFEREGSGVWEEVDTLVPESGALGAGASVSISGNTAIVGAPESSGLGNRTGRAFVFRDNGVGNWSRIDEVIVNNLVEGDEFGYSVSLVGDVALVGTNVDNVTFGAPGPGKAYLFQEDNFGDWNKIADISASDGANRDRFGSSVSLGVGKALVGAPWDDDVFGNSGSVYVFETAAPILPGDYNNDLVVDAADYTVWRDNLGEFIALPNETVSIGFVTEGDYTVWKENYGDMLATGSAAIAEVPEPTTVVLMAVSLIVITMRD